ncbi:unnamed protein product [Mycena citricolor]|uniref:SWIM-type domain-containing protein n=1 Tax=Mycena citricolor TaxID=2018698 RepID=A0AAD2JVD1_9AGAR|nr:unnamed protein product [Mycena citricolor]
MSPPPEPLVKCTRCTFRGPQSAFPQLPSLQYTRHCHKCREKNLKSRGAAKEKEPSASLRGKDNSGGILPKLSRETLLALIREHGSNKAFETECYLDLAEINLRPEIACSPKAVADELARQVWEATGYRFVYKQKRPSRTNPSIVRFEYHCAQLEGEKTKNQLIADPKKRRARVTMDYFACNGWLNVIINELDLSTGTFRLSHHLAHTHYTNISISDDIKSLVKQMKTSTPTKIWEEVVKLDPTTELTERQIYRFWSDINQGAWRKCDDQVASALALLQEYEDMTVEIIELKQETGLSSIAFCFCEIINDFGKDTEEIAMDSTWKTNAAGYELYAIVAEANGTALPLAFVFTTSTGDNAAEGAKDRMLQQVLGAVSRKCPNIQFVHTDKDISEINAAKTALPGTKHQLCMWHGPRYVKERLAEDKRPAHYDPRKAHMVFDFIDPTWAPGIDRIQEDASQHEQNNSEQEEDSNNVNGPDGIQTKTLLPPIFVLTQGDIRHPIYPNPPKARKTDLGVFCPPEHRDVTLDLYKMHGRLHPEIPVYEPDDPDSEEPNPFLSADAIYNSAVYDMYFHCFDLDLSQLWAYMWNRWYSPAQWKLWARASEPAIPRINTTMIVESLWKHVKHRDLAEFNRPRLDLVTHVIILNLLPRIKRNLDSIRKMRRAGRGPTLVGWQKDFRATWVDLSKSDDHRLTEKQLRWLRKPKNTKNRDERLTQLDQESKRTHGTYFTYVDKWVCSCSAFLMSRFLLCKHLVREVNQTLSNSPLRDLALFANLRRNHFPPYYVIPGIHDIEENEPEPEHDVEIMVLHRGHSRSQSTSSSRMQTPEPDDDEDNDRAPSPGPVTGPGLDDLESIDPSGDDDRDEDNNIRAFASDDEGTAGDRVYISEAQRENLKRSFEALMETISRPSGIAPQLAEALRPALQMVEDAGGHIQAHKRKRKSQRTYKDSNKYTMFTE